MIPSHVLSAGTSPMLTQAVVGAGAANLQPVGNNQLTALQLPASNNLLNVASAPLSGVKLPRCEAGAEVWVANAGTGQTIVVYPFETDASVTIMGNPSLNILPVKGCVFKAITNTFWMAVLSN